MNEKEKAFKDLLNVIETLVKQVASARKHILILEAHLTIVEKIIGIDTEFPSLLNYEDEEEDD